MHQLCPVFFSDCRYETFTEEDLAELKCMVCIYNQIPYNSYVDP